MPRPRGRTGDVRGVPADLATEVLEELVALLAAKAGDGRTFVRADATRLLREKWELDGRALDGFVLALERMPGLEKLGGGIYRLPPDAKAFATNRLWRYSLRLDLADAELLYTLLYRYRFEQDGDPLTPTLERHAKRLGAALKAIFPEGEEWPR